MSNCPHCQAPIPAPKPGASRPLNFCQACGKSLPAGLGAAKSSPAKTLMWSGGPIPGLPVKPAASSPAVPPAPAPAAAAAVPAATGGKRRTATSDIGIAATLVPPDPDLMPVNPRLPQKTVIGSGISLPIPGVTPAAPPSPADVDVAMDEGAASAYQNEAEHPAAPEPSAPASPASSFEPSGPKEVEGAVPEWAGGGPSDGMATKVLDRPGQGPNKLMIAGIAGGGLLVIAVVAGLMIGGKSSSTEGQAAAPTPVPAAEPPKPEPTPVNPAPVATEPVKAEPARAPVAEAKAEAPAPEKAAAPAEPAVAKPVAAVVPAAEKKPVQEKVAEHSAKVAPAPKAALEPAAEKPRAPSEPAPMKTEKTAPAGGDKVSLAAEAFQRGNAKLLSGALPEAIAAFSEAIKLNPKDAPSQRGLGLAYAESGNAPVAVRHLKLYLKAAPRAPDRALIEKRIGQLSGR